MRKILSLGLLVLLLYACASINIRKGDKHFEVQSYSKAIKHYSRVYPKKSTIEVENNLAEAYMRKNRLADAEAVYSRLVIKDDVEPVSYFNYGRVLMGMDKHEEAIEQFKKYLEYHPDDVVASMLLASCKTIDKRFIDPSLYDLDPIIVEDLVNTFSVQEYRDGIVFTADKEVFLGSRRDPWTGKSYLNLFYMEKDEEGNWLPPEVMKGALSGPFHDGPATFTKDGETVYFTRSNYTGRRLKTDDKNVSNLKIFKATLVDGKWKNLEEFPYNSDEYSVGHPTLSADEQTLYFVSDMPGGFGGTDLYMSTLKDGEWSEPENLGKKVNSPGNEMFPYKHSDGSLYFSSDAHSSMGGLDVFVTYFTGEKWARPENLNYPINSSGDDFAFTLSEDNKTGFVSSSRTGQDQMYAFSKRPPTFYLRGLARHKDTNNPVQGVTVEITNKETDDVVTMVSDEKGEFSLRLSPESEYLLLCTKEGCFSRTDEISTKGLKHSRDFFADFIVEEIVIDKPIVLENIYYDFDRYEIREDAAKELDKLVKLLEDNPQIDIEMGSHTDSRGTESYNMVLSERRAMSAVYYLFSRGIDPDRLTWKGYGFSKLVNHCEQGVECSREEHQKNRRTEFKVTRIRD